MGHLEGLHSNGVSQLQTTALQTRTRASKSPRNRHPRSSRKMMGQNRRSPELWTAVVEPEGSSAHCRRAFVLPGFDLAAWETVKTVRIINWTLKSPSLTRV